MSPAAPTVAAGPLPLPAKLSRRPLVHRRDALLHKLLLRLPGERRQSALLRLARPDEVREIAELVHPRLAVQSLSHDVTPSGTHGVHRPLLALAHQARGVAQPDLAADQRIDEGQDQGAGSRRARGNPQDAHRR